MNNDDSFKSWAHIANDKLLWFILINNIGHNYLQPCDYNHEWDGEIPECQPLPPEPPPENSSPSAQKKFLFPPQEFLVLEFHTYSMFKKLNQRQP